MLTAIKDKLKDNRVSRNVKGLLNKTTVDDKLFAGVKKLHMEYKKSLTTALSAALAFVMALYIRDVVQKWITWVLSILEISEGTGLIYQTVIALVVLTVCVLGIVFLSRWTAKKE